MMWYINIFLKDSKNMRRLSGFSLMEMMVVLLIVSIVAAASAPMISKKVAGSAEADCPWTKTGLNNNIAYNMDTSSSSALIGYKQTPSEAKQSKLCIISDKNFPQLSLGEGKDSILKCWWRSGSVILSSLKNTDITNVGTNAVALGGNAIPSGEGSIAIGHNSKSNNGSVSIGQNAESDGGIAIGQNIEAGSGSVILGKDVTGTPTDSVGIGKEINITGSSSVSIGKSAQATQSSTVAIGHSAHATGGTDATAVGPGANAYGTESTAIGYEAQATDKNTTALGGLANATKEYSVAIGYEANSKNNASTAVGWKSVASGFGSAAYGSWAHSTGDNSTAVGYLSSSSGNFSTSIDGTAEADNSVALCGTIYNTLSQNSIAIGHFSTVSSADGAIVIGAGARSNGATGSSAPIGASNAIVIGREASADSAHAIALGYKAKNHSNNLYAIAIGYNAGMDISSECGQGSIAIGREAGGNTDYKLNGTSYPSHNSVAIGRKSKACNYGIAIGNEAKTNIKGVAIGASSKAEAEASVAIGNFANANTTAPSSIAIGRSAWALGANSISIGRLANDQLKYSSPTAYNSIAIGYNAVATANAIAIGSSAYASSESSGSGTGGGIAIGTKASSGSAPSVAIGTHITSYKNSIAIGIGTKSTPIRCLNENQILLGNEDTTVYIPGKLVVGHESFFGHMLKGDQCSVAGLFGNGGVAGFIGDRSGDGFDMAARSPNQTSSGITFATARDFIAGKCDRRLKNVGETFKGGLEELKKLELFHFTYKSDKEKTPHVGVMAQDLQKVFPNAVTKGEDGYLRIRWEDMFYALINAVKELDDKIVKLQKEEICTLKKDVATLKSQNAKLEKQNADLEKRLAALEKKLK